MAGQLTEAEILRYSRQILVGEVGGQGQLALLQASVRVRGVGAAVRTAAAYLAAGGTRVQWEGPPPSGAGPEEGFWATGPAGDLHATGWDEDACGQLGSAAAPFRGAAPWVALGSRGGVSEVIFRDEAGCAACFEQRLRGGEEAPKDVAATQLGALGALVFQRLLLRMLPAEGTLRVDGLGAVTVDELPSCGHL